MKIIFYFPTIKGKPLNIFWRCSWYVSAGFKIGKVRFVKYQKELKDLFN